MKNIIDPFIISKCETGKPHFLLVLFFVLAVGFQGKVFGQNREKAEQKIIDSLYVMTNNSTSQDTVKANAYLKLSFLLERENPDTLYYFCNMASKVLENLGPEEKKTEEYYRIMGTILTYRGFRKTDEGLYNEAIINYQEATKYFSLGKSRENKSGLARVLNNIGGIYRRRGETDLSLEFHNKSLEIYKLINHKLGISNVLNNIGLLYYNNGQYNQSLEYFLESLKIREELGAKVAIAGSLNNIGNVYTYTGQHAKRLDLLLRALKLCEQTGDRDYLAATLQNLGGIYKDFNDYEKSLEFYFKGLKIREEMGDKPGIAGICISIGFVYEKTKEFNQCLEYHHRALKIGEEIGDMEIIASALNNMGSAYFFAGNFDKSYETYLRQLKMAEESQNKEILSFTMSNIGILFMYKKKPQEALLFSTRGLQLFKEINAVDDEIVANCAVYSAYSALGKQDSALFYLNEAHRLTMQQIKRNYFTLTENQKLEFLTNMKKVFDLFYLNSFDSKNQLAIQAYDAVQFAKGIGLRSAHVLSESFQNNSDTLVKNKFQTWVLNKQKIDDYLSQGKNVSDLEFENLKIENDLIKNSLSFANMDRLKKTTHVEIQTHLKKNECAIEFIHFDVLDSFSDSVQETLYGAYILFPDRKEISIIKLFSQSEIAKICVSQPSNNENYIRSLYGTFLNHQTQLYDLIWKKIDAELVGVTTVYFAPSGILHKINFSALRNETGRYLSEKYQLHQLNSTAQIIMNQEDKPGPNEPILVMGGIQYTNKSTDRQDWPYLLGTQKEAENISQAMKLKKWPTILLSGPLATEQNFKKEAPACGILHVSTHGYFFPDPDLVNEERKNEWQKAGNEFASLRGVKPYVDFNFIRNKNPMMRSGLVLAGANDVWEREASDSGDDGILTASEIANLNLSKSKLVVLSACETGLGDIKGGEGVFGLQRALKIAGAQNLIMSLWKVPDVETEIFMTDFYKRISNGQSINTAFRQTQHMMQKKYDPYYWAAFVLIE